MAITQLIIMLPVCIAYVGTRRLPHVRNHHRVQRFVSDSSRSSDPEAGLVLTRQVAQVEAVTELVEEDELNALTVELTELVRSAVEAELGVLSKFGEISWELDRQVKNKVAVIRGKEEYELGDLTLAMDELAKEYTCKLTGNDEYEFGDLSLEIDRRVKSSVASFCGKDTYEFGDLTNELDSRIRSGVEGFTGKEEYEIGDVSKELNRRREEWMTEKFGDDPGGAMNDAVGKATQKAVKDFTGKDEYEFGDLSKAAVQQITGKDEYEFGDVTKSALKGVADMFNKKKKRQR